MTQPAIAEEFEVLSAEAVIDRLLAENSAAKSRGSIGITCSFQAEDMIVLHLLQRDTELPLNCAESAPKMASILGRPAYRAASISSTYRGATGRSGFRAVQSCCFFSGSNFK